MIAYLGKHSETGEHMFIQHLHSGMMVSVCNEEMVSRLSKLQKPTTENYYKHYKGGIYYVIGVAKSFDDIIALKEDSSYVVYGNKEGDIWVRPYDMFYENITHNGHSIPRFEKYNTR